jgi:predicted PurR-regulated permease PerM
LPTKVSSSRDALPRAMSRPQLDRVLVVTSQMALVILGTLAVVIALALGKDILAPLSLAIFAGLVFGPVADQLERRGIPAGISSAVVVLGFIAVIGIATYLFAGPISDWIARGPALWQKLQTQLAGLKEPLQSLGAIQDQLKSMMGNNAAMTVEVQDGGPVQNVALMAPALLASVLLFLAGLYFFLATRHHIRIAALSLCFSRRTRWRTAHVFRDVELKVSKFLLSAAAINLGVGVATTLATWALGLPSPLVWGALAAVLNFIPYVGQAVMIVVLLAVGLGTQSNLGSMLLPVVAYGAINLTADQIVFPHLVGRALTLNPFIIFVSTAFWIWVWGPVGGFIAVPSLLVLQSIILHVFPTTAAIPERTQRKLEEAKVATEAAKEAIAEAKQAAAAEPLPATPVKPKRAPRKAAIAGSP